MSKGDDGFLYQFRGLILSTPVWVRLIGIMTFGSICGMASAVGFIFAVGSDVSEGMEELLLLGMAGIFYSVATFVWHWGFNRFLPEW